MLKNPRWEWRTFGQTFGTAEERVRALAVAPVVSRETYVIRMSSAANVKIRDGELHVKLWLRSDEHGLQQWSPVIRTPFPIDAEGLQCVYVAWNRRVIAPPHASYTVGELRAELQQDPEVAFVEVVNERYGTTFEECHVEYAALTVGGERINTMAVEHEDAAKVWHAVRALGLESFTRTSYVKALKRVVAAHA